MKVFLTCLLIVSLSEFDLCAASDNDGNNEETIIRDYKLELSNEHVKFNVTFSHETPGDDSIESQSRIVVDHPLVLIDSVQDNGKRVLHIFNPLKNTSCTSKMITTKEPFVDISAKPQLQHAGILAIAYKQSIAVWSLTFDNTSGLCQCELLQKIRIDKYCKQVKLFQLKTTGNNEPILYLIVLKALSNEQDSLSIYQWLDSGFHMVDEKTIGESQKNELTLLDLSECHNPAIFIQQVYRSQNEKYAMGLVVFQLDNLGKLQLRQRLHFNRIDQFHPYTLDCNSYNFRVCTNNANTSVCSIYSSRTDMEFVEERKYTHMEAKQEQISYVPGIVLAWSHNMTRNGRVFLDAPLSRSIDIVGIEDSSLRNLTDMIVWAKEDMEIMLLLVSRDTHSTNLRLAGLKLIESEPETVEPSDPLVRVLQDIRKQIFAQKFLLDQISSIVARKNDRYQMEQLRLNKAGIANGKLKTVNIKSKVFEMPSKIRNRLETLQAKIKERKSQQEIRVKKLHVDHLECDKSHFYTGVRIDDNSQKLIFGPKTNVTIKNMITSNVMNAEKDHILKQEHQQMQPQDTETEDPPLILRLHKDIKIDSLFVGYMNRFNVTRMHDEAFLRNRDRTINGSLLFRQQGANQGSSPEQSEKMLPVSVHCYNITAKMLNQREVSDLFTLKTNQTVHSNIVLSKFLVLANVSVSTLNGQSTREIALATESNTFKSPISIGQFVVSNDLILSTDKESDILRRMREHFSQVYTGRVRINGRLNIKNLEATPNKENAMKLLRETNGDPEQHEIINVGKLSELFWTKDTEQSIETSVQFSSPIQIKDLSSTSLNGHPLSTYVQRSKFNVMMFPKLVFKSVKIQGNLNTDLVYPESSATDGGPKDDVLRIEQMSANLVRRSADRFTEISGKLHFTKPLKVSHLLTKNLGSVSVGDLVRKDATTKDDIVTFRAPKTAKILSVRQRLLVNDEYDTAWLNSNNLTKLFTDAVLISESQLGQLKTIESDVKDADLGTVMFLGPIQASNVNVDFINERSVPFGSSRKSKTIHGTMGTERPLVIRGNVVFKGNLEVNHMNDIDWKHYNELLVLKDASSKIVGGEIKFLSNVSVSAAATANHINSVDMSSFFKDVLRKSGAQTIRASWQLNSPHITHLVAKANIDGVPANFLIRQDANVKIRSDLTIASARLRGNVVGKIVDNSLVNDCLKNLRQMKDSAWSEIRVRNNVVWPNAPGERSSFEHIRDHAVRTSGVQKVLGRIKFIRAPKFRMISLDRDLAGVNIARIAEDALLKDYAMSSRYYVTAPKYFENHLQMDDSAEYYKSLEATHINGVDIKAFNQSILRKTSIDAQQLLGHKQLSDRTVIEHLMVHGLVNSISLNNIFFASEHDDLPAVRFTDESFLRGNSLSVEQINGIKWDDFLSNRVQLSGEGQTIHGYLTFENLRTRDATLPTVNDINLERVVYKELDKHQIISGSKTLANSLHIDGPSSILNVDGTDLAVKYHESLFTDRDYKFESVQLVGAEKIAFQKGLNIADDFSKQSAFMEDLSEKFEKRYELLDNQVKSLEKSSRLFVNEVDGKFLYLDHDHAFRISSAETLARNCSFKGCSNRCATDHNMYLRKLESSRAIVLLSSKLVQTSEQMEDATNLHQKFSIDFTNNCTSRTSQLRIEHYHEIDFPRTIENVWTIDQPRNDNPVHHVLLEFQNPDRSLALCLLRMDSQLKIVGPVQELRSAKNLTQSSFPVARLFRLKSDRMLMFASNDTSFELQKFQPKGGHFVHVMTFNRSVSDNLMEVLSGDRAGHYQAIIGSYGGRILTVNYVAGKQSYVLQRIEIPDAIDGLLSFESDLGSKLLAIYTQKGYYYVYRYVSNIDGWLYESLGIRSKMET